MWIEEYLFELKTPFQKLLSFSLLPLSWIYCFIVWIKKFNKNSYIPTVPVISIGNLTVGGSSKTPTTITLANRYQKSAVILRGYKRKSKAMVLIKDWNKIIQDVTISGDEAQVYAQKLKNSLVIVSKDRVEAIEFAIKKGAKIIFLDDGHSKYHIKKLDILIKPSPEPKNSFCLPSGCFREPLLEYQRADFVLDEKDIIKTTKLLNPSQNMVFVTAIAKPKRLDPFLPKVVAKYYFKDHHDFSKKDIDNILGKHNFATILCTYKDYVKLQKFNIKLCILDLDVTLPDLVYRKIDEYLAYFW